MSGENGPMSNAEFVALPRQAKNITAQRFGRLIASGPIGKNKHNKMIWLCQCDCGNTTTVLTSHLLSGNTASCGCHGRTLAFTHKMSYAAIYKTWDGMRTRCNNPKSPNYKNYGARDIKVCDEWLHSFEAFYDHVSQLQGYGTKGLSLDRINNSQGYFNGNVRWATSKEQHRNTRQTRMITFLGRTQCVADWSAEIGVSSTGIRYRLRAGWNIEKTLTTPSAKTTRRK